MLILWIFASDKMFRKSIEKLIFSVNYRIFFIYIGKFYNLFVLICHFTNMSSN